MKNPELDLHDIRHRDVDLLVENFVYTKQKELPVLIVCGNSQSMINEVEKVLNRIKCQYEQARFGIIRVNEI